MSTVPNDKAEIAAIFDEYIVRKQQQNVLDYDDLLLKWNTLASTLGVGDRLADRFDHILVDEYQDTNLVQAEILLNMRRCCNNIMVVGDECAAWLSWCSRMQIDIRRGGA